MPYYISIGMTADEFWHGEPYMAAIYRKAHEMRNDERNQELWLQGLYIYDAVAVALANGLSKRGVPKQAYLDKPLRIRPLTEAEKEAEARKEREKITRQFEWLISQQNARKRAEEARKKEQQGG